MDIEKGVGQLFLIGLPGPEVDEATESLLKDISPGGICLFARNIRSLGQTRALTDAIRARLSETPFLSIDQEGGLVDRLRRVLAPMPAASKIRNSPDAGELAYIIGTALRHLGLNMDLAPVVDVIGAERISSANGLYSRTFGNSKESVCDFAGEFLRQLERQGVLGCLKHFPGLGASTVDSHEELPVVNVSENDLETVDLFPYRSLLASHSSVAVMVGHAAYPNSSLQEADQNGKLLPSSLSYSFVTKLLRNKLGFDGVVVTDDMEMGAIVNNYGIGEAAVMAIEAGNDMVAVCAGIDSIYEAHAAVREAIRSGRINSGRLAASLERIAQLRNRLSPPADFAEEKLAELSERIKDLSARLN